MAESGTSDSLVRALVLILAVIVLSPVIMMVFAVPMGMMGGWGGRNSMMGTVSPLWGIGISLVWLVVIVGIGYLVYRGLLKGAEPGTTVDPALEELRLAYARGDLTDEEFEDRRETLSKDR